MPTTDLTRDVSPKMVPLLEPYGCAHVVAPRAGGFQRGQRMVQKRNQGRSTSPPAADLNKCRLPPTATPIIAQLVGALSMVTNAGFSSPGLSGTSH
jgi:hypothetical protein